MSIATEISRLTTAKSDLKTAIEAKGVTVGTVLLDEYASKVAQITTGGGVVPTGATLADYEVDTGQTITTGDLIEFIEGKVRSYDKLPTISNVVEQNTFTTDGTGSQKYMNICCIDTNKFLVVYDDGSSKGMAQVLTLSNGTVSAGSTYEFWNGKPLYCNIVKVDTDKAFLSFRGSNTYGYCQILTVSGTTISSGTQYQFNGTVATTYMYGTLISTNKVLLAYIGASNYGYARAISVSGTDLTIGNAATFKAAAINSGNSIAICKVDTDKAFLGYYESSSTSAGVILTVSTLTITVGTELGNIGRQTQPRACLITTNKVLYSSYNTSSRVFDIKTLTVSNTTLTNDNNTYTFTITTAGNVSALSTSDNNAILTAYVGGTSGWGIYAIPIKYDSGVLKVRNRTLMAIGTEATAIDSSVCDDNIITTYVYAQYFGRNSTAKLTNSNPQGVANESGVATETIECYDWR